MTMKKKLRYLILNEGAVSGAGIFANAEVMSPEEFVQKYSGNMPPEVPGESETIQEMLTRRVQSKLLDKLISEAPYVKRFPKPPQKPLTPGSDIRGTEVDPTYLAGVLGKRSEREPDRINKKGEVVKGKAGDLPGKFPYVHPATATDTIVPASSLSRKSKESEQNDIVIVGEDNKPIDLSALKRIVTNYNKPKFGLLKQNDKMKKSTTGELEAFFNIGIPAIMGLVYDERDDKFKIINTCPGAGSCMQVCYATKGGYVQYRASSENLNITLNMLYNRPEMYVERIVAEIIRYVEKYAKRSIRTVIRWHDAGDFFSEDYLRLAHHTIERVKGELPSFLQNYVKFYAYTKRPSLAAKMPHKDLLLRKSLGAKPEEERLIDPTKDMFSQIVPKSVKDELEASGAIVKKNELEKKKYGIEAEAKWTYAPNREEEVKLAIQNSKEIKFKNSFPMLTMAEYEQVEDDLGDDDRVNVIILPGENDRPAKDIHVAGVYLMFH